MECCVMIFIEYQTKSEENLKVNKMMKSDCIILFLILQFSCDHNKYSIDYILALSECKRKRSPHTDEDKEISDSEMDEVNELDSSDDDFMTSLMDKVT